MNDYMVLSLPPAEVLYNLAKRAKQSAREMDRSEGPNSMSEKMEHIGNGFLIANEGRGCEG